MIDITELSYDEADKIEQIAGDLHKRVEYEIVKFLKEQLEKLGCEFPQKKLSSAQFYNWGEIKKLKKIIYPNDPDKLCTYEYDGKTILGVRIGPNGMSIMFDMPVIETEGIEKETQKEVQDDKKL